MYCSISHVYYQQTKHTTTLISAFPMAQNIAFPLVRWVKTEWNVQLLVPLSVALRKYNVVGATTTMTVRNLNGACHQRDPWVEMAWNVLLTAQLNVDQIKCYAREVMTVMIVLCEIFACPLKAQLAMMGWNVQFLVQHNVALMK